MNCNRYGRIRYFYQRNGFTLCRIALLIEDGNIQGVISNRTIVLKHIRKFHVSDDLLDVPVNDILSKKVCLQLDDIYYVIDLGNQLESD